MIRGYLRSSPSKFFLAICVFAFAAQGLAAEDDEVSALRRELETLKQAVQMLDQRLKSLERGGRDRPPASRPAPAVQALPTDSTTSSPPEAADVKGQVSQEAQVAPPPQTQDLSKTQEQAIRSRWKKLSQGMTKAEVESILGKPGRIMEVDRQLVWYYRYSGAAGSVVFSHEGRVTGWQKPPFGLFW